jgi:tRNA (guanine-N7-)-methyltransferase
MRKLSSLTLPWTTDWAALFGRAAPLILEIGFGTGAFLRHLSHSFPDHNIVGLEVSNQCLTKAEGIIERERLGNVRVIHSRAETALQFLFAPGSLCRVYVNFPDPWFKTRHSGRRLMQRDTLDALVNRMERDAQFFLATDIVEYARMSDALLGDTPGLANQLDAAWATEPLPGRIVTKYEATARREGRACYYFHYRRTAVPAPFVPDIKEMEMPHIVFAAPFGLDEIQARFEPLLHIEDGTMVKVTECYRGRHVLLFEAVVKEPSIDQHIALTLRQHRSGDYTLMLNTLGHPRVTPGVHRAAALLGDWLLGLHPDAHTLNKKLSED